MFFSTVPIINGSENFVFVQAAAATDHVSHSLSMVVNPSTNHSTSQPSDTPGAPNKLVDRASSFTPFSEVEERDVCDV